MNIWIHLDKKLIHTPVINNMAKKRINSIPKRIREEALEIVTYRGRRATDYQRPIFNDFVRYYRLYRFVRDSGKQNYQGQANLFIPYIYANIENAYPKMIADKPRLNVMPREKGDIIRAEVNEKLLDYQWYSLRLKEQIKPWIKQGLMYGVSPLKVVWEFDSLMKKDNLNVIPISVFNFLIDPDATSMQNANYVIHETWRSPQSLRNNKNYDIPRNLEGIVRQYNQWELQMDAVKSQPKTSDSIKKLVKVQEYWGLFDINDDGVDEQCLITVANDEHVIRIEENPYKHKKIPFVLFRDTIVPNELWSIGEIAPVESLQYELNDMRNQRMDNVTQILRSMPIINRASGIKPYDVQNWQNGGILEVNPVQGGIGSAIDFLRPPDVTSSSYNEETLIKADIQFVSSLSEQSAIVGARNVRSSAQETATGAALAQEESNSRFRAKLDNLEDALTDLGGMMIALNQQYIDKKVVIRVLGEEGKNKLFEVKPDDIKGDFDLTVEAGATQAMNKQLQRRNAQELYQQLSPLFGTVIDPVWAIRNLLDSYGVKDTEKAFIQKSNTAEDTVDQNTGTQSPQQQSPQPAGGPQPMMQQSPLSKEDMAMQSLGLGQVPQGQRQ